MSYADALFEPCCHARSHVRAPRAMGDVYIAAAASYMRHIEHMRHAVVML